MTTGRKGAALIEAVIALTMFAVVMTSLASFTMVVSTRSQRSALRSQRTAATTQAVNMLQVLPYDSLPSRAGCTDVVSSTFSYQQCVTVTAQTSKVRRVQITITPANPVLAPDTIYFERGRSAKANPLNVQ